VSNGSGSLHSCILYNGPKTIFPSPRIFRHVHICLRVFTYCFSVAQLAKSIVVFVPIKNSQHEHGMKMEMYELGEHILVQKHDRELEHEHVLYCVHHHVRVHAQRTFDMFMVMNMFMFKCIHAEIHERVQVNMYSKHIQYSCSCSCFCYVDIHDIYCTWSCTSTFSS
jgi:hypothetical protein